jgi:predicted Zn-dependent peptidase
MNNKATVANQRLNESYLTAKLPSGLTVYYYPMKGYASAMAVYAARYGSVDITFKTANDKDFVTVPAGIAHYLEHKLFENADGSDAAKLFAQTGANCNAATGFGKTDYYFSCSREFYKNLAILLDFVQSPYFTPASVEKERGIIEQEISMYDDSPYWRSFINCLESVYVNNPVRINIAGTAQSIAQIDADLLYRCYNTFYNPHNMCLAVAGDLHLDRILDMCETSVTPKADPGLQTSVPDEPYAVGKKLVRQSMSCAMPLFNIGFKQPGLTGKESAIQSVVFNIALETALGSTSLFYDKAVKSGLFSDNDYHVGVLSGRGFFLPMVEGEAVEPEKVLDAVKNTLLQVRERGADETEFENVRKKTYGQLIKQLTTVHGAAAALQEAFLEDRTVYDLLDCTADMTAADVSAALKKIDLDNCTLSIIDPV